jgi:hypothetical protein
MSILIEHLIEENTQEHTGAMKKFGDKWYIAKPMNFFSFKRIKDAIRVLTGKSQAFHYMEDIWKDNCFK